MVIINYFLILLYLYIYLIIFLLINNLSIYLLILNIVEIFRESRYKQHNCNENWADISVLFDSN